MTTFINTPTGNIGRRLAHRLLEAGEKLVLLHREPSKLSEFAVRGASLAEGSTDDREALGRGLSSAPVDNLFWVTPPAFRPNYLDWAEQAARAAAETAAEHGVRRVVMLSSIGAQSERVGPVSALSRVEAVFRAALEKGGIEQLVILRPGFFMENFLRDVPTIAGQGAIYAPVSGDKRIPLVATRDIAAVAAEEILAPAAKGLSYRGVHGPTDLTHDEVARIASKALGRDVSFVSVPEEVARQSMTDANMPGFVTDLFLEMYAALREGRMDPAEPRTEKTTTSTDFATFVQDTLRPTLETAA